jgi:hypothetical protein
MHKLYELLFAGMPNVILADYQAGTETLSLKLGISL